MAGKIKNPKPGRFVRRKGFLRNVFGSENSNNFMSVHLDKRRYCPGDMVTGSVTLSVCMPMNVDGIFVKFKGFELVKLVQIVTRSHTVNGVTTTTTERIPHKQKLIIFQNRVAVQTFKALMNPGIYVYPFSFRLQSQLPGSFSIEKPDFSGQITYKVKAEAVRPGMFASNLKSLQFINVINPHTGPLYKVQKSRELNVTKCCCIDMGTVEVSAIVDKNAFHPGQVVKVIAAVDNTSSDVSLQNVSYSLQNQVFLKTADYIQERTSVISSNEAPKIKKGDTAYIEFSFALPYVMNPSMNSNIVNSFYILKVILSVPYSSNLEVELPIRIYDLLPVDNNVPAPIYPIQPHISAPIHVYSSSY